MLRRNGSNSGVCAPNSQPLVPMPEADSPLVVGWLARVRLGCILAVIVVMSYAAFFLVVAILGVILGPQAQNAAACVIAIVGAVSVWLLVSPEPRNWKWLWLPRWILRIAAVVLIGLCAASMLIFGIFPLLPEVGQSDPTWSRLAPVITMSLWSCLGSYLRRLAQRLGDSTLRKNFSVFMWIAAVAALLGLLVFACSEMYSGMNSQARVTTPTNSNEKTVTTGGRIFAYIVYVLFYAWTGWLMWRLSRRLRSGAERIAIRDRGAAESEGQIRE